MTSPRLLDPPGVLQLLRRRGLLGPTEHATATTLTGGVSSAVTVITREAGEKWVTKQALPQLRVTGRWLADPRRGLAEGAALRWYATVTPDHVPAVIDVDTDNLLLVTAHAPHGWSDWRDELSAGRPHDATLGAVLGQILADWHRTSARDSDLAQHWQRPVDLRALRTDPYFRRLDPDTSQAVREALHQVAVDLERPGTALVHGDFCPKNMLIGSHPTAAWVIDAEVTHWGDPLFDVAFLLAHLTLQSLETPKRHASLRETADQFISAWQEGTGREPSARLTRYTGAMLLTRVYGQSQLTTLTEPGRRAAAGIGAPLLTSPGTWDDTWQQLWTTPSPPGGTE